MAHRSFLGVCVVLTWLCGMNAAMAEQQSCSISQSPGRITFSPTAWPSSTPASQSFTITINCTQNTPVDVDINKNTSNLSLSGTNIPYSLCLSVVSNVCSAAPLLTFPGIVAKLQITKTLHGFLAPMSAPYAPAGTYTDSSIIATTSTGSGVKALNFALAISKSCSVSTSPLNFGTLALNTTSVKTNLTTASTTLSVRCTNGTSYTVGLDAGTGPGATTATRVMSNAAAGINYQLWRNSTRTLNWGDTVGTDTQAGTGTGSTRNLTIYGSIAAGQAAVPGTYNDTINVILIY